MGLAWEPWFGQLRNYASMAIARAPSTRHAIRRGIVLLFLELCLMYLLYLRRDTSPHLLQKKKKARIIVAGLCLSGK
jgi:hypothetical protein